MVNPRTMMRRTLSVADMDIDYDAIARKPKFERQRSDVQISHDVEYNRIKIHMDGAYAEEEEGMVAFQIRKSLSTRYKYKKYMLEEEEEKLNQPFPQEYVIRKGIFVGVDEEGKEIEAVGPSIEEFADDVRDLWLFCKSGPTKTFTFKRLELLQKKMEMYLLLNWKIEEEITKGDTKDFYDVYKVDNHLHMAAAMTSTHLLDFIIDKANTAGETLVYLEKDKDTGEKVPQTLDRLLEKHRISKGHMNLDALGVQASNRMFHRFDHFNAAYNPFGQGEFRSVFLKTSGVHEGKFFAQLSKEVFKRTEDQKSNVLLEPRVSIYGKNLDEWNSLADWIIDNEVYADNMRWLVQIPRIYSILRTAGGNSVGSFQDQLFNIFQPLFEITMNPEKNPKLAELLEFIVGFDSVDDESKYDAMIPPVFRTPDEWTDEQAPSYAYTLYYVHANISQLNHLRTMKGLNTFSFRPHCGEAGNVHHLATGFLLADGINHGINLSKNPTLQYLFYLTRLGISVSPLSNNNLFCSLENNPFHELFLRGLNVALSTDDPMLFHTTQEPLIEEYTIAKQFWKMSFTDLSEVARNSVLQSGFRHDLKIHMLGSFYELMGALGNDETFSNIPDCRASFRHETLRDEFKYLLRASAEFKGLHENVLVDEHKVEVDFDTSFSWEDIMLEEHLPPKIAIWVAGEDYNLPGLDGEVDKPNHLSLQKGEHIVIKERMRNGFWRGESEEGVIGLFPPDIGMVITD